MRRLFSVPTPNPESLVRSILLIVLLAGWVQAIDLTVNTDFAINEDTPLVFSYGELLAKCTITSGPSVEFKISGLSGDGAVFIASSATGPWDVVPTVNVTLFTSGQFIRFVPNLNIQGNNVRIIDIRARTGAGVESTSQPVNVDIAPINDLITATSGIFVQPASPKVTEDTRYTFTWQQLKDTLGISEPDSQAWTITLTGVVSGKLYTTTDVLIDTFPATLTFTALGDNALRWQADLDAYTKPGAETTAGIGAFTAKAVNTTGSPDESAVVTFKTPVVGVTDVIAGATTMTILVPLILTQGEINDFTYEELHALIHGSNDVDRIGVLYLDLNTPGVAGCTVTVFDTAGTPVQSGTTPLGFTASLLDGYSLHITVPDALASGMHVAGISTLRILASTADSNPATAYFDVRPATGGSAGGSSSDSGGGGCGAGGGVMGILIVCCGLGLRRRRSAR